MKLRSLHNHIRLWSILTLASLLIMLSFFLSVAQAFSSLTLEIATEKNGFLALEPIPLRVRLRNDTTAAVTGHSLLDFSFGFVDIWVAREGGDFQAIQNLSPLQSLIAAKPRRIPPGQVFESHQLLLMDLEKIFPEPGFYQIKAVLYSLDHSESIESNVTEIDIIPPIGRAADAFHHIKTSGAESYFFTGLGLHSEKQYHASFAEFARLYGDTPYGPYAHHALGQFYLHTGNCTQAVASFQRVTLIHSFALDDESRSYLDQCKKKLK